ncbi:MAG: hypothetical protein QXL14_00345 [Candidatus Aenigmatarchaeota archaeon]
MTRKGYKQEYNVKKKLQKEYGDLAVIKVAIGSYLGDFIILGKNSSVIKIVEVKKRKSRFRLTGREKEQYEKLKRIKEEFGIDVEYWIFSNRKLNIIKIEDMEKFSKI